MLFSKKKRQFISEFDGLDGNSSKLGFLAERQAGKYLKKQGLKLIQYNYHCRFGEIDIIAKDKNYLIFVEVRLREQNAQVSAVESISLSKQKKVLKTAQHYLQQFEVLPDCRVDVIAMTHDNQNIIDIEWLKSCF